MKFYNPADAITVSMPWDLPERPVAVTTGRLERLPKWLNLFPMIAQWLALSLKYRSVTLPSCANPSIISGGMVGEGKLDYFTIMGDLARSYTANYTSITVRGENSIGDALAAMNATRLSFPVIVKPDIGWCGYGVQLIHDQTALRQYLARFPTGETLVLQRFCPEDGEAGIFYARFPHEPRGRIIGILLRTYPSVTGDGRSTMATLIGKNPRLQRLFHTRWHACTYDPDTIPAAGQKIRLSTIGSTRVGGLYRDGTPHATSTLLATMDKITHDMQDFYLGRFDVRYDTLQDLQEGRFKIIEVNGAGSEAVHAWDPAYTLRHAYSIVFAKQRLLFALADENRKRGHKPIGLLKLARLHFHQQKLIEQYPPSN